MERVKNFINGRWIDSKSRETFRSINPANKGEVIGIVSKSDQDVVDQAIKAARGAYEPWRLTPAPRRGEILFRAAEILLRNKEFLGKLETREMVGSFLKVWAMSRKLLTWVITWPEKEEDFLGRPFHLNFTIRI